MVRNAAVVPLPGKGHGDGSKAGLSPYPNALRTGDNGGYQALGLAIMSGASRIILLGYDMQFERKDGSTKSHWHKGHPVRQIDDGNYRTVWVHYFNQLKLPPGVEVLNGSPRSAIKSFPIIEVDQYL